ncbi:SWIM zinc finger family protein [Streptomyces sulphureus]|uniref:SWIM zinc finger family protein n=1 Tax=Streptomyces sulphureus TaxID=47758 RepID=UPI00036AE33B|nr:SWIM zinc finger family protein [Streptomyces sulphureus]
MVSEAGPRTLRTPQAGPTAREFDTGSGAGAWLAAMAEGAEDPGRLERGRRYAREGNVGPVTVAPGAVSASVRGSRTRPYAARVRLPVLADAAWGRLLDALAAEEARSSALLVRGAASAAAHGALAEAAQEAQVGLLPEPGEPVPACTCPDRGRPCKHAAALSYQTALLLDEDPLLLLLLRGRPETEVLDDLAWRAPSRAPGAARQRRPGVSARAALATGIRPPLPPVEPLPPAPARIEPPSAEGSGAPDAEVLAFLATSAAARAWELLDEAQQPCDGPPVAEPRRSAAQAGGNRSSPPGSRTTAAAVSAGQLSVWDDAVRLAATHPDFTGRGTFSRRFAALAHAVGTDARGLARAAAAWRQGGQLGLRLLEAAWEPPAGGFDRARGALAAAGLPRLAIEGNRLTDEAGGVQLRYAADGRWYPYRAGPDGEWWPEGAADADPAAVLRGLLES